MDDSKIPSANIDDVDVDLIAVRSPSDAEEIRRLGALLDEGRETDDDIVRLGDLLFKYNEISASERLLRCNAVLEGGIIRRAYARLYGNTAEAKLEAAISGFAQQFQVTLHPNDVNDFLKKQYLTRPQVSAEHSDPAICNFLQHTCVVTFEYEPNGSMADIIGDAPELYGQYLLLTYCNDRWKQVRVV